MIAKKNEEKASISIRKIIGICLVFVFLSGICVLAANTQVKNLKIILSNDYEMDVMTSKTKVSEILDEKHIILLPDEKVTPALSEEVGDTKVIKIAKQSEQEEMVEIAQNTTNITMDQVLKAYAPITEKIVVEQVPIPFETITKDVSNGSSETSNRVIKQGKEGIKEVTYKVKYQNDIEIEKTEISSQVIQEPVNKIIQVKSNVTNRSSSGRTAGATSEAEVTSAEGVSLGKYKITAYCPCAKCCGKATGKTASGTMARANHTIAAPGNFAIGTKLKINGVVYTVEDRGGAIKGKKIDIFVNSHSQALAWGVRYLDVEVLK